MSQGHERSHQAIERWRVAKNNGRFAKADRPFCVKRKLWFPKLDKTCLPTETPYGITLLRFPTALSYCTATVTGVE